MQDLSIGQILFLIHWQARPKGHREFGIYDAVNDTYSSSDLFPVNYGSHECLMLDDTTASTVPSAVILFKGYISS